MKTTVLLTPENNIVEIMTNPKNDDKHLVRFIGVVETKKESQVGDIFNFHCSKQVLETLRDAINQHLEQNNE